MPPDGIISTHPSLIRRARHQGLLTIQRAFILDSLSLNNLSGQLEQGKPDFVEILPGIMPRVITEISTPHPGAGDRGRSAAGQGRRHGRHAGRCLGGVHLCPGAVGHLNPGKHKNA